MRREALPPAVIDAMSLEAVFTGTAGCILVSASLAKARDPNMVGDALAQLLGVPSRLRTTGAVCLISTELILGFMLLARFGGKVVLLLGGALFASFAATAVLGIRREAGPVPCGCFGRGLSLELTLVAVLVNGAVATGLIAYGATAAPLSVRPPRLSTLAIVSAVLLCLLYWLVIYAGSVVRRLRVEETAI